MLEPVNKHLTRADAVIGRVLPSLWHIIDEHVMSATLHTDFLNGEKVWNCCENIKFLSNIYTPVVQWRFVLPLSNIPCGETAAILLHSDRHVV